MSIKVKKSKSGLTFTKQDKEPSNPKGWKKRYDITCPHCQKEMHCKPSLFHRMGQFSIGGGSCPNCHEMMSIEFNPYANRMTTEKLSRKLEQQDGE